MGMESPLQKWLAGNPLEAVHLQQPVDRLNKIGSIVSGDPNTIVAEGPSGTIISSPGSVYHISNIFQGKIQTTGYSWNSDCGTVPATVADFDDSRYYVLPTMPTQTDCESDISKPHYGPASPIVYVVQNQHEYLSNTHFLLPGELVTVYQVSTAMSTLNPPVSHYIMWETPKPFIGQIVKTGPCGNEDDFTDARYWIKRKYITNTDTTQTSSFTLGDVPNISSPTPPCDPCGISAPDCTNSLNDNKHLYVVGVNLAEEVYDGAGGHNLDTSGKIHVEVRWQSQYNSSTTTNNGYPRWTFTRTPQVWLQINNPMPAASLGSTAGGGAYYNATILTGYPITIDPTGDLVIPVASGGTEVLNGTPNCLAENALEANMSPGDPPSHWVACGTFVPAWYIGFSNEATPRPTFRFALPTPGECTINITATIGSIGGSGGNGRYAGKQVFSRPTSCAIATTNLALPDGGETFGAPCSGDSGNTWYLCYENVFENNITSGITGTVTLLPIDGSVFVTGYFTGGYATTKVSGDSYQNNNFAIPIFRGYSTPQWWPYVDITTDGGSGSTLSEGNWEAPTYTYTVKVPTTTTILMTTASPTWTRILGPVVNAGTHGSVTILPSGALTLVQTDEQLAIAPPCTTS